MGKPPEEVVNFVDVLSEPPLKDFLAKEGQGPKIISLVYLIAALSKVIISKVTCEIVSILSLDSHTSRNSTFW